MEAEWAVQLRVSTSTIVITITPLRPSRCFPFSCPAAAAARVPPLPALPSPAAHGKPPSSIFLPQVFHVSPQRSLFTPSAEAVLFPPFQHPFTLHLSTLSHFHSTIKLFPRLSSPLRFSLLPIYPTLFFSLPVAPLQLPLSVRHPLLSPLPCSSSHFTLGTFLPFLFSSLHFLSPLLVTTSFSSPSPV